jgi:hypothetical protein
MWFISKSKVPQCINPRIVINKNASLGLDIAGDNCLEDRRTTSPATNRLRLWPLAGILAATAVVTFAPALGQTTKIPDSTLVRLITTQPLSSASNSEDDQVPFQVTEEVTIGGLTVISRGATAMGHVNAVDSKKRLGRAGKLSLVIDYVTASDGTRVRVRASSTRKGADKTGTVIIGTVLVSPLFLIMRGKDIEIPEGTVFNAYVDGDREISTMGPAGQETKTVQPATTVSVSSTPSLADILVDGKYMGSTPSTIHLTAGSHNVLIQASTFADWERVITVTEGGSITVNAVLQTLYPTHVSVK